MEKQRMTQQEALKELENLTIDYGKRTEEEIERLDEAVDMAIAALRAEIVRGQGANIGDRIAGVLAQKGMTQRELAERTDTTEVSISRYINNHRVPKATIIVKIANALGVSADALLGIGGREEQHGSD
jgi:ribosome-binding protein aMBF1 (putative translation factor)